MRDLESYTIHELEELTGCNRRTISYYISEGLLPRAGRRGRLARYGRDFLDRLRLIQRIKEQQDAGKLPAATLAEIGQFLATLDGDEVVSAGKSNQRLLELYSEWGGPADVPAASIPAVDADFSADSSADDIAPVTMSMKEPRARLAPRSDSFMRAGVAGYRESPESRDSERAIAELRDGIQEISASMRDELRDQMQYLRDQLRGELQQEIGHLHDRVRRDIAELREELREDLRRTGPVRTAQQHLLARGKRWARLQRLPAGQLKIARLRPDGNSWDFPVDAKMPMLDGEFTLLCEGRPSRGEGEFIALRVPHKALRKGRHKPMSRGAFSAECLVVPRAETGPHLDDRPHLVLEDYLFDVRDPAHAGKPA